MQQLRAPFLPNAEFDNPRAYGDLASLGNLPQLRRYRPMHLSSDALGFRRTAASAGVPDCILLGDSFAVSFETPDEATLPARLGQFAGARVYNAANYHRLLAAREAVQLADDLRMDRGCVVLEFLDRKLLEPPNEPQPRPSWRDPYRGKLLRVKQAIFGSTTANVDVDVTPGQVIAGKLVRRLQNGDLLPNPYAEQVTQRALPDGQTMLFLPDDLSAAMPPERVEDWAAFLTDYRSTLAARRLQLVVLLVPNKYSVYQPLLTASGGGDNPPPGLAQSLSELERTLRMRGVATVNALPALRDAAARNLARGETIYFYDDTHWNSAGIEVAARALAPAVAPLLPPAAPTSGRTAGFASVGAVMPIAAPKASPTKR